MAEQKADLDKRPLLSHSHPDRDAVAVLFPNVYVDPLVQPQKNPSAPLPLSDWVRNAWSANNRVLLIGPAGTGKTTALIRMQHHCADEFLTDNATRPPIFVEARAVSWTKPPTQEAVIKGAMVHRVGAAETAQQIRKTGSIILLDGLDEAFPRAYQELEAFDTQQVVIAFPHIAACRDDFFKRNLNSEVFCRPYDEILVMQPWTVDREVRQEEEMHRRVEAWAKRHEPIRRFEQVPGYGWIRAATFFALVDNPWRFHSKSALWKYVGIGLERRHSGSGPTQLHVAKSCNRSLKNTVLGAAGSAILQAQNAFADQYQRWTQERGLTYTLARRNVARSQVATLWGMWKTGSEYRPELVAHREGKGVARESK